MSKVQLSDLIPESKMVNLGRGSIEVNGLEMEHIGKLLSKYSVELEEVFRGAAENKAPDLQKLVTSLPKMVDEVVAMATGTEDQMDMVRKIPVSAKVEILSVVWELSVTDPKKLEAKLKELSVSVRSLRQASES